MRNPIMKNYLLRTIKSSYKNQCYKSLALPLLNPSV